MLSRLFTALFYAIVFFALGAWSGGSLRKIGDFFSRSGEGSAPSLSVAQKARPPADTPPAALADTAVPPPAASEASAPTDTPAEAPPAAPTAEPAPDLGPARTAFAAGDLSGAVAAYQAVLAKHPTDADALGELGNVYFNAGQTPSAVHMYMAAAEVLLDEGKTSEVRALLPAIRPFAPDLAAILDARLAASGPGQ
jgi:hypothetical protein